MQHQKALPVGDWDGIETVKRLVAMKQVPVIYLTAFTDEPSSAPL